MNRGQSANPLVGSHYYWLSLAWLLGIYCYLLYQTGWLSDDARITLVYVENLVKGNGAVFNYGERVQAYTHSLWFLLLSAGTYFWHNAVQVTYLASVLLSVSSFLLLARIATHKTLFTTLSMATLLLSAGFIDYSTSGLENTLSYFLFALLVLTLRSHHDAQKSFLLSGLLAALIFLNRPDYLLIVLPLLLFMWMRLDDWRQRAKLAALCVSPVLVWTLFSLFYYGVPVPNTAYAKLGAEIARSELLYQGVHYFLATAIYDSFTLLILAVALPVSLFRGNLQIRLLVIGCLLYLAYLVWIGGDFMLSRHLSVPAYLSIALLVVVLPDGSGMRGEWLPRLLLLTVFAVPLLALPFHHTVEMRMGKQFYHGISDERFFWSQYSSLKSEVASGPQQWIKTLPTARPANSTGQTKTVCGWLGVGKVLDPGTHMVDKCGLTDPLLARMPALQFPEWRIGHFERALPFGYLESLEHGSPLIDSELATHASRIAQITRGELVNGERLNAIIHHNLSTAELTRVLSDYRIDIEQLQALRKASRVLSFEVGAKDSSAPLQRGVSWRIVESASEIPSVVQVVLNTPGTYKVVLEYVDTKNEKQGDDGSWENVDYVVAILRDSEGTSVQLTLPQKANLPNLVYVHVVPLGVIEDSRAVTIAFE